MFLLFLFTRDILSSIDATKYQSSAYRSEWIQFLNLYCFLPDGRIASNGKRKRVNDFNLSRYNTFTVYPVTLSSLSILLSLRFLFVSDDDSRFVWLSQSRKSSFRRDCAPRERIPCFYESTFLMRRESRELCEIRTNSHESESLLIWENDKRARGG